MKKRILVFIAMVSLAFTAKSQDTEIALRHIKGIKSLDLGAGTGFYEINYEAGLSIWHGSNFFMHYYFNFEHTKIDPSDFTDYTVQFVPNYTLFKIGDKMYFNINLGLSAGMQKIKEYKDVSTSFTYAGDNKFIYGGVGGANLEFYVNKSTALVLEARQFYFQNYDFGTMKYQINGTIRFIIN